MDGQSSQRTARGESLGNPQGLLTNPYKLKLGVLVAHEVLWLAPLALLLQSSSSECPEIMAGDVNGRGSFHV